MKAGAEFLVGEKDGVGLPVFIEQNVLEPDKLICLRQELQNQGLVFERPEKLTGEFHFPWFNLSHPHTLRRLIESTILKDLNHEDFLRRYGEFLYGINKGLNCYPSYAAADFLVIVGQKNPVVSLSVQQDQLLEATRSGIIIGVKDFIRSYGVSDVEASLRGSRIGSQLFGENRPLIQLGQVRKGSSVPAVGVNGMTLRLSPPHLTHVVFK